MTTTRGLEGVVATTSSVSSIIDDTLTYAGYNIDDLAENASFEEVVYLLWHRKLPTKVQLEEIKKNLLKMQRFRSRLSIILNLMIFNPFIRWQPFAQLYPFLVYLTAKQM